MKRFLERVRAIRLGALGGITLALGLILEILDQLGALDLSPILGTHGPHIIVWLGIAKIVLRVVLIGYLREEKPKDA